MKITHVSLLVGLALGAALAFGTFSQFFLVLLCGALGLAVGMVLEGRVEIRGVTDRWRQ